jgi:hypothetical protein
MHETSENQTACGLAALSVCESLPTSLQDKDLRVIGVQEVVDILKDASAAHHQVAAAGADPKRLRAAAAVIDRVILRKNSVRHT